MVVIERTQDIFRARVIVSFLRSHGVDAQLLDAQTSGVLNIVGGVRIVVPDAYEGVARKLLDDIDAKEQKGAD
ncbi:MAG: DUF2007 domain-containing protein [Pseudomonadota bacterium]